MNTPASTKNIVVVDGICTGKNYPSTIKRFGLVPVHVSSNHLLNLPSDSPLLAGFEETMGKYERTFTEQSGFDALVESLQAVAPRGIVAGTETGVELAEQLNDALHLPGNPLTHQAARRDKFQMHQQLAKAGVAALQSACFSDWEQAQQWAAELNQWPIIVKPPSSAGTQGVVLCDSMTMLKATFDQLIGSKDLFNDTVEQVLLQEFAQGTEYVVNTVSCNGTHVIAGIWQYEKRVQPGAAPLYAGAKLIRRIDQVPPGLIDYAMSALDALKIQNGPAHTEIMVRDKGPVMIECGARPMGGDHFLPQALIKDALGYTQLELALQAIIDPEQFLARKNDPYLPRKSIMCKLFISDRAGELQGVPAVNLLTRLNTFYKADFSQTIQTGLIHQTVDLLSNCGTVTLCHEDDAMVMRDYQLVCLMENEMPNELFTLRGSVDFDSDWVKKLPDEMWLKPEENGRIDAAMIIDALQIHPGHAVLDCPCGDCRLGVHIAATGCRYVGIDLNANFIAKAKQRFDEAGLQGTLQVGDMLDVDDNQTYDLAINWFNSLGYGDVENDFEILRMFARVLKPGGHLLLESPNRNNLLNNLEQKVGPDGREVKPTWDSDSEQVIIPFHLHTEQGDMLIKACDRIYTPKQLELLLTLAGFTLVRTWADHFKPFHENAKRIILLAEKM